LRAIGKLVSKTLESGDPVATQTRIRDLMKRRLRELDSNAKVEWTGYFNHSLFPDFILTWGGRDNGIRREGFLRFSLSFEALHHEADLLSRGQPLVLGLREEPGDKQTRPWQVGRVLAIPVESFDVLTAHPRLASTESVIELLLRRGSGFLDLESARALVQVETWEEDELAGLFETDRSRTIDRALAALSPFLSEADTAEARVYLETVALGIAATEEWSSPLVADQDLLLRAPATQTRMDRETVWGPHRTMGLDEVGRALGNHQNTEAFERLVNANAERWKARRAVALPQRSEKQESGWHVWDGRVARGVNGYRLLFQERGTARGPVADGRPLSWTEVVGRAATDRIEEVTVERDDGELVLRAANQKTVTSNRKLESILTGGSNRREISGLVAAPAVASTKVSVNYRRAWLDSKTPLSIAILDQLAERYLLGFRKPT
jgi:hypothetical protein